MSTGNKEPNKQLLSTLSLAAKTSGGQHYKFLLVNIVDGGTNKTWLLASFVKTTRSIWKVFGRGGGGDKMVATSRKWVRLLVFTVT